jgi:dolichyl-phosphate-mannose--protein O-mannosyl transferase
LNSFGGFASKYIKGKFFMDVHPPLAKLLLTLAGWLAGFDGEFDFKDIGKDYLEPGVPYVAMRMLPAICGILLVPTMFLTLKAAGCRTMTAAMGAGLIIFGRSHPLVKHWELLTVFRKRPPHPSSIDPPRFPSHDNDCVHRIGIHVVHESA